MNHRVPSIQDALFCRGHAMIRRGVCTPLRIIACPLDYCGGHAMIPKGVYTSLRIIACPLHAMPPNLEGTR